MRNLVALSLIFGNTSHKFRDIRGTFHAKIGSIKDRKGMDLTEAENIKKRWQEYTEELCKKDLHDPDNHDGVITHLEPDILECEVKWTLGSITTKKADHQPRLDAGDKCSGLVHWEDSEGWDGEGGGRGDRDGGTHLKKKKKSQWR